MGAESQGSGWGGKGRRGGRSQQPALGGETAAWAACREERENREREEEGQGEESREERAAGRIRARLSEVRAR